jgi:hypothetical protein
MDMRKAIIGVASLLLLTGTPLFAQKAVDAVDPVRYPTIAAAQKLCADAIHKINAAQRTHERDMGGHAQKAKDLLVQASEELRLAALASELNGH